MSHRAMLYICVITHISRVALTSYLLSYHQLRDCSEWQKCEYNHLQYL